jgi:predicted DNA-binding transcriptional regulator YafY
LIYIYVNLYEKETITYDEINSVSLISKRTFLRDLETLRDILITQTIVFDENNRYYTLEDI